MIFLIFLLSSSIAFSAKQQNAVRYPTLPFVSDFGGSFELKNLAGKTVTDKDFHGKFVIMYFGYSNCADICPLALYAIGTALTDMGALGEKITPLFVNLDTENATADDLKQYVEYFHPRFIALTGTAQQTRNAASSYRIQYRSYKAKDGKPLIVHSGKIFLLGPNGKPLAYFPHEAPVEWLVQSLTQHLRENKKAVSPTIETQ